MRTFGLLCCFILLTAFTCENEPIDSDFELGGGTNGTGGTGNTIAIEGTWKLTSWDSAEAVDVNNDGTASTDLLTEFDCYNNETMVFNSGGTGVNQSTSYAEISLDLVVGTTDSYEYSVDCIDEVETTSFTWTQSGNTITVTDEFNEVYDLTLDGNELSILIPEGFYAANEDFTVTTIQDVTFIYTKQ